MKIITCNFQGRKHLERNERCEDSVNYVIGSKVTTVAVADGAGSKIYEHAKDGADAVTKAVCGFFEAKFDDFFDSTNELELRTVIQTICHKALKERANELGLDSIDTMASTLLAVSIKGNKAVCVQIGDGLIGRTVHGELEPITLPQNGEYASSTYFVNSANAYKMIQIRKLFLSGTSHVFLMSDGVADCMFNDFNGVFNTSLSMLIDTADEPDGEEKVRKAIKEFIVDADPMSDDCTMAVVCLGKKESLVSDEAKETEKPESDHNEQKETVAHDTQNPEPTQQEPVCTPPVTPQQPIIIQPQVTANNEMMSNKQNAPAKKKKGSAWKIISVTLALILAIIIGACAVVHFVTDDKEDSGSKKKSDSFSSSVSTTKDEENEDSDSDKITLNVNSAGKNNNEQNSNN